MAGKVYVRDIEILQNLQGELNQFNYGANKVLEDVARDIAKAKEFLRSRANYWSIELRRREEALRNCLSSDDEERNCNREVLAVREAEEAINKLKKLQVQLEQAEGEYRPYANRLHQVLNSKIGKAKQDLQRSIDKYRSYLEQRPVGSNKIHSSISQIKNEEIKTSSSDNMVEFDPKPGITWAEKQEIIRKMENGQNITLEELDKLSSPVTDLKAETLQDAYSWTQDHLQPERFLEATRDLWRGEVPTDLLSALWSLIGIGTDYLKWKQFWKNEED